MSASWCDQLNEGENKLTRLKPFFVIKCPLWEYLCVGNLGITYGGYLFHFYFMEDY